MLDLLHKDTEAPMARRRLPFWPLAIAGIGAGFALWQNRDVAARGARTGAHRLAGALGGTLAGTAAAFASLAENGGLLASSPTDIPARGWKQILRRTYREIGNDRVLSVAGGVAFFVLLAVFPAITAFISIYGLVADPSMIAAHLNDLSMILPMGAVQIVGDQAMRLISAGNAALTFASVFAILLALWSANGGAKALIESLNVAYDKTEKRSFVRLNLVALLTTFGIVVLMVLLIAVSAVLPAVLNFLPLGHLAEVAALVLRWPLIFVILLTALSVLYRWGVCNASIPWRWITPGAVLAAAGLMVFSMAFSLYATHFTDFDKTYGSLGAVIGFLTWLWLSAAIVLAGAELNAEVENQAARRRVPDLGPLADLMLTALRLLR